LFSLAVKQFLGFLSSYRLAREPWGACLTMRILLCLAFALPLGAATTFRTAVQALGPANTGAQIAREIVTVLNRMSEELTYTPRAREFFVFMNDALESFDFAGIYNSKWLSPAEQNFRKVVLTGRHQGAKFQVDLDNSYDPSTLGNSRAEYRMRKNEIESDTTFTTQLRFDAALKRFDAQGMARFLETLLHVLSPENITALKPISSPVFANIQGPTRPVIDQLSADFSTATAMLSRYIELKSFAEVKTSAGKNYTDVALRGRFHLEALGADYPRFKSFLMDIRKLFVLQLYLSDTKGQNLMSFIINTNTEEFYWAFRTANGKLLPTGKDGQPVFAQGITLTGKADHKFYGAANFFINVYGLKINTGVIGTWMRYTTNNEKMSFYTKITQMPEGQISGALFGVLPTWMIDLSIPSDLQTLMNKFSQTMFKANNGEGTWAEIAWSRRGGDAALNASASTEFLENQFIRIGMKIWVKKFRPNDGVQDEIRQFIGRYTRAILTDLGKF